MAYPDGFITNTTDAANSGSWVDGDMVKVLSYYEPPNPHWTEEFTEQLRQREREYQRVMEGAYYPTPPPVPSSTPATSPQRTLTLIKKSVKQIKAEAVGEKAQKRIQTKVDRLRDAGALAQATILETELQLRVKLMRLQEWDYKVLPYDAIKQYESANKNWDGQGGRYKVHIDLLERYCGTTTENETEAKDKIIPDEVLDKLEDAKERQVFDEVSVLWVEKIKDPLLLGSIKGCKDFFLICEWGDDVKFDDMVKDKK